MSTSGMITTDIGSLDYGSSVTVQTNGKILIAGYSDTGFALVRYNSNGSLDTTFSDDGKLTTDFGDVHDDPRATVQTDGKILVAGGSYKTGRSNSDFALARYNTDGSLDDTFSDDGKLTTDLGSFDYGYSVTVQTNGKILVAGVANEDLTSSVALVRYNTDVSFDTTFSDDGKLITDWDTDWWSTVNVTVQTDGKILVAGNVNNEDHTDSDFALARYNTDGSLDTTFNGNHSPVFTSGNTGTVTENAATSTVIYTATAFDEDDNSLSYSLSGTDQSYLNIHSDTGEVTLKSSADYETKNSYSFVVSVSDGIAAVTNNVSISVANANDAYTGGVTISGTKAQGQTLTASNTLADADGLGSISYQWEANNVAIGGATSSTYRLTQSEVGKAIKVTASYTDNLGTAESATSVNTSSIANAQFAPTEGVTISGTAAQNQTLTANTSLLADADGLGTLSYVWKMSGKAISGATASTYALTQAHVGNAITVVVSYKDGDNKAETVTSAATSSVVNVNDAPTVAISISTKTAIEGKTFSLTIPTNTFADLDKDTLTYTAKLNGTLLTNSDWITLASGKLTATKVPYTAADTANTVTVIANDGHGGTVFTSFALNVTNTSTINGTAANDAIVAGNGNDTLNGGVGNDTLAGGDGTDYFVLNAALSTTTNRDTITDFTSGDHILLENAVFKKLLVAGALNTANFVSGVAVDANDYILYNSGTGVLSYDADGSGKGAAVQIALIGNHAVLAASDFIVI